MKPFTLAQLMLLLLLGCNKPAGNTYAIKDFRKELRPYLTSIISRGLVGHNPATRFIQSHATDNELRRLSHAEHPLLRAVALREMLNRKTFNRYDVMMEHLDDTAIASFDYGEFGICYYTVADDMLQRNLWKDSATKMMLVEEVVLKHNYLAQAYYKAGDLPVAEKYYTSIKQMALRPLKEEGIRDIDFNVTEYALYALARYKKPGDVPLIKQVLETNVRQLSDISFGLMAQYPDTGYISVCEDYHEHNFYRRLCESFGHSVDRSISYISSIATYKNERSGKILDVIFNGVRKAPCIIDKASILQAWANAVQSNYCPAYHNLIKQANKIIHEEKKSEITLPAY